MLSGAFGGVTFWVVTFPMDVVKSRQQISVTRSEINLFSFLLEIARKEGYSFNCINRVASN